MNSFDSKVSFETESLLMSTKKERADVIHIFRLSPGKIAFKLFIVTGFLLAAHIAVILIQDSSSLDKDLFRRLDHFFNFNKEGNIPTFYSYALLFIASILLFIIYKLTAVKSIDRKYWLLLSVAFLFVSLDEAVQIHERINSITRHFIKNNLSGLLYWAWVVPYTLLFLALGVYVFRFVFRLPVRTRKMFLLGGIVFFIGAVGIEIVEGYFINLDLLGETKSKIVYNFTVTIQELLEMCGVIIFIYELMRYIVDEFNTISFSRSS